MSDGSITRIKESLLMRKILCIVLMMSCWMVRAAETSQPAPQSTGGISLTHLIERSAARLNKRFIVDPRVAGQSAVLVGIDPDRISYRELQAVLAVHGFMTTQERNGVVEILPSAVARQTPMPLLGDRAPSNIGEDEYVTRTLDTGPLQAVQLVPILRPMLPQEAHLVAGAQVNSLIVVARYANVRMIEAIVNDLKGRPQVAPKAASTTE
jgi:general secretion pathway protein D